MVDRIKLQGGVLKKLKKKEKKSKEHTYKGTVGGWA